MSDPDRPVSPWPTAEEYERIADEISFSCTAWPSRCEDFDHLPACPTCRSVKLLRAASRMAHHMQRAREESTIVTLREQIECFKRGDNLNFESERVHAESLMEDLLAHLIAVEDLQCRECEERAQMAQMIPQWQPIETAPKDGRWLLLQCPDGAVPIVGNWFTYNASKDGFWQAYTVRLYPTHWMPLPDPPHAPETGSV